MSQATLMKSIMEKLGFAPQQQTITLAEHVRIVAEKVGEARKGLQTSLTASESRGNNWRASAFKAARRIEDLETELATLKAERDGILRDKLAESERAKLAEQRVNSLLDEIAALKPDAEKHREKLRRDRAYVTSKRAQKVVLAA
jgi:chromosome segregation ATPase